MSISAEAGPGFSGQLGPIPAVEAVVPGVHGGDPRATRRALTSDGAARVGRRCGPPGSIREARTVMSGAVLETPALVAGFENVAVMDEAVEQCRGHLGVTEDARPFGEGEIGRQDGRGALVKPADQVEQHPPAADRA